MSIKRPKIIEKFAEAFANQIKNVPNDFYGTFNFTKRGNNLTHPWTLGCITKILWKLDDIANVYIDCRNNVNGVKFQPDITATNENCKPLLYVDYESPNSSDARIPAKNVNNYIRWNQLSVPYIIITTLPKKRNPRWELRYTSIRETNENHKKNREEIRKNPFNYWYNFYIKELRKHGNKLENIHFLNIDDKQISFESINYR